MKAKGRKKDRNQRKEDTNKGKERRTGLRDSQRKVVGAMSLGVSEHRLPLKL